MLNKPLNPHSFTFPKNQIKLSIKHINQLTTQFKILMENICCSKMPRKFMPNIQKSMINSKEKKSSENGIKILDFIYIENLSNRS